MSDFMRIAEKHRLPHRLLTQLVIERHVIRVSQIIDVFCEICESFDQPVEPHQELKPLEAANKIVKAVNKVHEKFNIKSKLEIVSDERFPDEQYVIFVPLTSYKNSFSTVKQFNPVETVTFNRCFNFMFQESPKRGEIPVMTAMKIGCEDGNMRPIICEEFLEGLVAKGTFVKYDNNYSLHPQAVVELRNRLTSGDVFRIPKCPVCLQLIILGRFSTVCKECCTEIHNMCIHKLLTILQNTQTSQSSNGVACPGTMRNGSRCKHKLDEVVF